MALQRRAFITLLGGVAAFPVVARAQQPGKLPVVGFIVPGTLVSHGKWLAAFAERLRELGWVEGRTVAIEYRWAEGRAERYAEFAADLVSLKVNVIVTSTLRAVIAAKQATSAIPIIFTSVGNPVSVGLVQSLARPGSNLTGLSQQGPELGTKRLELLREMIPDLRRVAVMANPANPSTNLEIEEVQLAARQFSIDVSVLQVKRAEDIGQAIEASKGRVEGLYVIIDPLMSVNQDQINARAIGARLPTLHGLRDYVVSGGLMSYGANFTDLFRRAGDYVDKILHGANPATLPVEQPTKFDLVVNLKTAKAIGVTIPPTLLARADEVIE
jgi:putative tryptophan/tyrosine transport system substrate-binding protein